MRKIQQAGCEFVGLDMQGQTQESLNETSKAQNRIGFLLLEAFFRRTSAFFRLGIHDGASETGAAEVPLGRLRCVFPAIFIVFHRFSSFFQRLWDVAKVRRTWW